MLNSVVVSVEVVEPFNPVSGDRADTLHMEDGSEMYVVVSIEYPNVDSMVIVCEIDDEVAEFSSLPQSYQDMCMSDINQWIADGCGSDC